METTEAERGGGELEVGEPAGDDLRGGVDAVEADHGGVGDSSPDLGAVWRRTQQLFVGITAEQSSSIGFNKNVFTSCRSMRKSFKSCF